MSVHHHDTITTMLRMIIDSPDQAFEVLTDLLRRSVIQVPDIEYSINFVKKRHFVDQVKITAKPSKTIPVVDLTRQSQGNTFQPVAYDKGSSSRVAAAPSRGGNSSDRSGGRSRKPAPKSRRRYEQKQEEDKDEYYGGCVKKNKEMEKVYNDDNTYVTVSDEKQEDNDEKEVLKPMIPIKHSAQQKGGPPPPTWTVEPHVNNSRRRHGDKEDYPTQSEIIEKIRNNKVKRSAVSNINRPQIPINSQGQLQFNRVGKANMPALPFNPVPSMVALNRSQSSKQPEVAVNNRNNHVKRSKIEHLPILHISGEGKMLSAGANKTPSVSIQTPHQHDVLCGRGGYINSHPGNCTFRTLVNERKEAYKFTSRLQKAGVARDIVDQIRMLRPPGKFLVHEGDYIVSQQFGGSWVEIGDAKAVAKTSQALREGAHKIRTTQI